MAIYRTELGNSQDGKLQNAEGEYEGQIKSGGEGSDLESQEKTKGLGMTLAEAAKHVIELRNSNLRERQGWELKRGSEAARQVMESDMSSKHPARFLLNDIRNEWNRRNELSKSDPDAAKAEAEARDEISERTGKPKKAPRGKPFKKGSDDRRNAGSSQNGEGDGEGEQDGEAESEGDESGDQGDGESKSDKQGKGKNGNMQSMKQQLPKESTEDKDGMMENIMRRIAREEDYKVVTAVDENFMVLSKELARIAKLAQSGGTGSKTIILDKHLDVHIEMEGLTHEGLERCLKAIRAGFRNIFISGPAGSGKTTLAKQVAEALGKLGMSDDFGSISCSIGMTEAQLFGRLLPLGDQGQFEYMETDFVRIYENGGVFLLDEIDACDANVLVSLNAPLDNGRMFLPNRKGNTHCRRHANCVVICAANTWGHGADKIYVGRNKLDGAFLRRWEGCEFAIDYDRKLEAQLCSDKELLQEIWRIRDQMRATGIRRVWGSTGTIARAVLWRSTGMSVKATVRTMLGDSWSNDDLAKIGYHGAKPAGAL